jgi:hypothetical protein
MINHLASALAMINQEDGSAPGKGLSIAESIAIFAGIPIALFLVIAGISYALTGDKKSSSESSITHIE